MKFPLRRKFRNWCADRRVKFRYGTVTPTAIRLVHCDHLLEIDPNDRRARQILVRDTVRGKSTKGARLWRMFNRGFSPEVLVDIGLNYGECLMGCTYPESAALFGFEANPHIFGYAERSKLHHPNQSRMRLFNILVSDEAAKDQLLFVDPNWSGTGSAVAGVIKSDAPVNEYKVDAERLDQMIPQDEVAGRKLLFKIDIEGYEPKAMKGFAETLRAARHVIGLMEFDTKFLKLAGTDPVDFLTLLNEDFEVFSCGDRKEIRFSPVHTLGDLPPARKEGTRQHTDLLLIKKSAGWQDTLSSDLSRQLTNLIRPRK